MGWRMRGILGAGLGLMGIEWEGCVGGGGQGIFACIYGRWDMGWRYGYWTMEWGRMVDTTSRST